MNIAAAPKAAATTTSPDKMHNGVPDSDYPHPQSRQRGGITFDPTINAGHLLTFAGFIIAGFVAYSTLDTRITVVENRIQNNAERIREQDARVSATLAEIKSEVKDTNKLVNIVAKELAARGWKQ